MLAALFSLTLRRSWLLILVAGLVSLATSFGLLMALAPGWAVALIAVSSETVLTTIVSALIAVLAMSLTSTLLYRRLRRRNQQLRTAIDSMAQGLCMFDTAERLVVCNTQYYEMYSLTADDVRPGA